MPILWYQKGMQSLASNFHSKLNRFYKMGSTYQDSFKLLISIELFFN